jgi:hypothetical protein
VKKSGFSSIVAKLELIRRKSASWVAADVVLRRDDVCLVGTETNIEDLSNLLVLGPHGINLKESRLLTPLPQVLSRKLLIGIN